MWRETRSQRELLFFFSSRSFFISRVRERRHRVNNLEVMLLLLLFAPLHVGFHFMEIAP
jgi:hypothetical protein